MRRVEHGTRERLGGRGGSGGGGGKRSRKRPTSSIDISKLQRNAVVTETAEVFVPEHAFSDFPVDHRLKANVVRKGYSTPTPIQDRAIPHVLRGEDVVGIANTGTGKTAAFLIPVIDKILKDSTQKALIVVPTRELAIQIQEEFKGFAERLGIFVVLAVGGTPMGPQLRDLSYRHHLIIGTPGRIRDLIQRKRVDLTRFRTVVLDEADRMLDMGFIDEMRFFMSLMPTDRQTLFFSATLSKEIEGLIHEFLNNPIRISVKTQDTSKNVDQAVEHVGVRDKIDVLANLLSREGFDKVLVFGRTKHGVENLAHKLKQRGFRAESIHGDKNLGQRKRALEGFKKGIWTILVATDVAARGLDIPNVSHVINFDMPSSYEDYIHRIGRTGRAGKTGKAITFVD
jgi:superfamily II DNA/RNA helicase